MAKITDQANVLVTKDYSAAVAYWRDKLGFSISSQYGEPPQFAILKRDNAFVMIGAAKTDAVITPHWKQRDGLWNAYFWVDDARSFFDEMKGRGAIIDYELEDKPYGVREFGVRDLDDHDIGFGQVLDMPE